MKSCTNQACDKPSYFEAKEVTAKAKVAVAVQIKEAIFVAYADKYVEYEDLMDGGFAANELVEVRGYLFVHATTDNARAFTAKVLIDSNVSGGIKITIELIDKSTYMQVIGMLDVLLKVGWACKFLFLWHMYHLSCCGCNDLTSACDVTSWV